MFLAAIEFVLIWVFILVMLTQVLVPIVFDRPLFPWFRRDVEKARDELRHIAEQEEVVQLEHEIKERLEHLKQVREADHQQPEQPKEQQ